MKTTTSTEQIKNIIAALAKLHKYPFQSQSCDPKYNAQRNLNGLTHYVDDDTLRWHKSRVVSTQVLHDGLLFRVTCSDALDMNNTRRGFRSAVFDMFGTCVSRPELENASTSKDKAIKASDTLEVDLVKHYADALASQIKHAQEKADELQAAAGIIAQPVAA